MDEDRFNQDVRKFLHFGVTAQRAIEKAVAAGISDGRLKGSETVKARGGAGARRFWDARAHRWGDPHRLIS